MKSRLSILNGMRSAVCVGHGKRRAPVEPGDELGFAHVLDVEDDEPAVPVAGVEPVAGAQRVMALVRGAFPGRLLAARDPLPRHPPAADFLGLRRILQVEDHHDVADIAVHRRRDVGIAAVEVEAMHAARIVRPGRVGRLPVRDQFRLCRVRHVVDAEPAVKTLGQDLAARHLRPKDLTVGDHDVVATRAPCANACRSAWKVRRSAVDASDP